MSEIIERIKNNIEGRVIWQNNRLENLLSVVEAAGDGDYLEIGVLHGGSIIAVAMWKKEHDQAGHCYGYDIFEGYDEYANQEISLDNAMDNVKLFDVQDRVTLIEGTSLNIPDREYAVVYIDGNHQNGWPWRDWLAVKDKANYIIFDDNYPRAFPAVRIACEQVLLDPDYEVFLCDDRTLVLKKSIKPFEKGLT